MAFPADSPHQIRMLQGFLADNEKSRPNLLALQNIEHLRGKSRVRHVVERQRDLPRPPGR
jgi:hypothetical protein